MESLSPGLEAELKRLELDVRDPEPREWRGRKRRRLVVEVDCETSSPEVTPAEAPAPPAAPAAGWRLPSSLFPTHAAALPEQHL